MDPSSDAITQYNYKMAPAKNALFSARGLTSL